VETLIGHLKLGEINLYLRSLIYGLLLALLVFILTTSPVIAATFWFLSTSISIVILKRTNSKRYEAMNSAWPEVIDHLITGVQSGLSINESLAGLANRGPTILRPIFQEFTLTMSKSGDFTTA
jgi:tight adherence protein B